MFKDVFHGLLSTALSQKLPGYVMTVMEQCEQRVDASLTVLRRHINETMNRNNVVRLIL